MDPSGVATWVQDHSVLMLAGLAVVEGVICLALLRAMRMAREEMRGAQSDAAEAVRTAALAAPGAIDPEAVLALLREGHAPTLDNVYAMMRRREQAAAGADPSAPTASPEQVQLQPRESPGPEPAVARHSEFEERMRQL